MRADIKVGMAIAVILIGIGVVWFIFFRSSAPPAGPTPGTEDTTIPGGTDNTNIVVTTPHVTPETTTPLTSTDSLIRPPYGVHEPVATTGQADVAVTPAAAAHTTARSGAWDDMPDRTRGTTSLMPAESTASTAGLSTAAAQTYVVKDGDTYWTIAQTLWGDGSLYPHLQKANPAISSDSLRPRMTIKVPPKPVPTGSTLVSSAVAAVSSGTTGVDSLTGKRYYIVKKDDNGFWDIAKAVYGDGKHWKLIESANPGLDSRRLRPGQKVWCPDRPAGSTDVVIAPARTEPAYVRPTTTAPAAVGAGEAGAPTRTTLPDGRVFD